MGNRARATVWYGTGAARSSRGRPPEPPLLALVNEKLPLLGSALRAFGKLRQWGENRLHPPLYKQNPLLATTTSASLR